MKNRCQIEKNRMRISWMKSGPCSLPQPGRSALPPHHLVTLGHIPHKQRLGSSSEIGGALAQVAQHNSRVEQENYRKRKLHRLVMRTKCADNEMRNLTSLHVCAPYTRAALECSTMQLCWRLPDRTEYTTRLTTRFPTRLVVPLIWCSVRFQM